jgi:hypothetical protein
MRAWAKHGRRPQGWWEFEAPFPRPDYERERSALYEAGLLGAEERTELVGWWREQFLRTFESHFFFCDGPGRILEGATARRKHFKWADIPQRLIDEWTKERQGRSRRINAMKRPRKRRLPKNPRRKENEKQLMWATSN